MLTAVDRERLTFLRACVAKLEALDRQLPAEDNVIRAAPVGPPVPAQPAVTRGSFMDHAREFPELYQFPESSLGAAH